MSVVRRAWRTWVFEAVTYLGDARLRRWRSGWLGRVGLGLVGRLVAGGAVEVRGGAAGGLLLSSSLVPLHHQQGYGLVRGVLEPGVQEALRRSIRPGAVVYDVGANIGFFTVLAAHLCGPAGRVEAFEPVASAAAAVCANAALNGFGEWVVVHEVAVGAVQGEGELLVNLEESWSHLADRGSPGRVMARRTVPVVALDALVARGSIAPPDVVKIDVEGSEAAVLRGLAATLATRDVTVICELHETGSEVLSLLAELGYASVSNLDGPEPVPQAGGAVHLLARRGEWGRAGDAGR